MISNTYQSCFPKYQWLFVVVLQIFGIQIPQNTWFWLPPKTCHNRSRSLHPTTGGPATGQLRWPSGGVTTSAAAGRLGWSKGIPKVHMDVSENNGTPKSSILIGFSIINHPKEKLGGGNSNIFGIFTSKIGEDEPNFDEHIFQMGVETTNQSTLDGGFLCIWFCLQESEHKFQKVGIL